MDDLAVEIPSDEFYKLVKTRSEQIRDFLNWAADVEQGSTSLYLANRPDIIDAKNALAHYTVKWWGLIVFTCFGSVNSAHILSDSFAVPIRRSAAEDVLKSVEFTRPKVGHHRTQATLAGAKLALLEACQRSELLYDVLHIERPFHERYTQICKAKLAQWGRTTCFDLLIRGGSIPIGSCEYAPDIAYLYGSSGPSRGFSLIWGHTVSARTATWCEGVVQSWHQKWTEIAEFAGVNWSGEPYTPGDLENALCVYQECRK